MTREPAWASPVLASFLVLACARRCAGGYSRWASPDRASTGCVGVATSGTDVYVGHGRGVERFDCADPLDCQSVAASNFLMALPLGIAFSSGYVYVATIFGIQLLNATSFEDAGLLQAGLECYSIAAGGSHMFAACSKIGEPYGWLHVIEKPLKYVATGYCSRGFPTTVFFEETTSTVYVGTDDGVQAFDALDPTNLVQGDVFCTGYTVTDIVADANHTWVVTTQGLRKFLRDGSGNHTFMVEMQLPMNSALALWEPLEHLFYTNFSEFGAYGTVSSDLLESYQIPGTNYTPSTLGAHLAVGESIQNGPIVYMCSSDEFNVFMNITKTEAPQTGSAPTSAPYTIAPPTNAPATLAPPTTTPATSAPATLAPATSAPPTVAPLTVAPATNIPSTVAPVTNAPPTAAPPTVAPATTIPSTESPTTNAPSTAAPLTVAPATNIPSTVAPATSAPPTAAPPTVAPATNIPSTVAPSTSAPPTAALPTVTPGTNIPSTVAPATRGPPTPTPPTVAPATNIPSTVAPATNSPSTAAPPTVAPVTNIPSTVAPATSAPPTPAPPTVAPATNIPSTVAPATSAPPTAALPTVTPGTNIPSTVELATDMPSTLAPTTNVPSTVASLSTAPTAAPAPSRRENVTDLIEDSGVKEVAKAIGTVVPVVVGTAALAGNSGGSGNRLLLVVSGCYTSAKHDFPFVFHPTSLVILESPAFGMVVGNLLLNAGFSAFCFLVLSAGRRFHAVTSFPHLRNLDIQGFLRLPSLPLLVFALLYQGSALGSMALIYDPPSTIAFVVGLCSAAFCVIVPVLVVCEVQKSVPSLAFFKEDDRYTGFGWRMAIGNGEWVSTTPKVLWAHRFQSVLTMYSEDKAWFGSMRFGSSFALAALSAPVTENPTSCGHVKLCSALVVLMELATMSWVWPYAKSRDALADVVTTLLEAGSMLFMAAGYYAGDLHHWSHDTASALLTAAMFTVGLRVVLDLGTEAFVFFTERRARLQELVFLGCRSGDGGVLEDIPSSNEPRGFGKEKSTSITLQLPDNSQGGGIELSPRGSMFSTEATALMLGASARQLSASLISSSPSDFVFTPLGDDPMDGALLVSPTLSYTSVLGDGRFSSSLRSPRRSSPRVHSPVTPVGRRSQRLASMGIKPLLAPSTSSPESHLHGLDDRRQQRSSFLSPLAEASPPPKPQIRRNLSSTVVLPLSVSCRPVRKSQPMPQTTSASTPSEAQPPPRRRRAYTVRTASTAAGLSANGRDRGSPLTSYEHSRAAV